MARPTTTHQQYYPDHAFKDTNSKPRWSETIHTYCEVNRISKGCEDQQLPIAFALLPQLTCFLLLNHLLHIIYPHREDVKESAVNTFCEKVLILMTMIFCFLALDDEYVKYFLFNDNMCNHGTESLCHFSPFKWP